MQKRLPLLVLLAFGCTAQIGTDREGLAHDEHEMQVVAGAMTDWRPDGEWLVSPTLMAPGGASRVGVLVSLLEGEVMPSMQARLLDHGTPITDWIPIGATWGELDHHVGIAELGNIGDSAELRIAATSVPRLNHMRWNAVIPVAEEELDDSELDEIGVGREALRSELRGLGIVTREAWGARATRCTTRNSTKTRMAIHYTVTPSQDPERQVRGIQRYHMDSRGWCDVGYHFLVGTDGSVYEGRPIHLLGSHVGGNNTNNIGIAFIGCFNPSGCQASWGPKHPPETMINAGGRLLGALSDLYSIPLTSANIRGHRDHSGASTPCPGDYLYARIGDMRRIGNDGTGTPPPPPPPPPTTGGSCSHSYGGSYSNQACSESYQCCDGRWGTRGSCGSCACVETTGRTGCTGSAPPPPPTPPPSSGASCTHSYGGQYADRACSAGYQCCDGAWGTRGSCGTCACVETTGNTGCGIPAPTPPPGASCNHTYGGRYANTACSAGYQCCDGNWRTRGSGCGECFCTETTGMSGCGT